MFHSASLQSMIAVFLASSTCWRSLERIGHRVLTFQVASHRASGFLLFSFSILLGANFYNKPFNSVSRCRSGQMIWRLFAQLPGSPLSALLAWSNRKADTVGAGVAGRCHSAEPSTYQGYHYGFSAGADSSSLIQGQPARQQVTHGGRGCPFSSADADECRCICPLP